MSASAPQDIVIAVCTYNRNAELDHLIGKVLEFAAGPWSALRLGMTVIDDSADGNARFVAGKHRDRFPLGLAYENSASRNISIARNLALTMSIDRAPWIAMTDDDCEPSNVWLTELARVAAEHNGDVATGLMLRRAPAHAPAWITQQPFLELGEFEAQDGQEMPIANTNNSLISGAFLRDRPHLRFDPGLGRLGGEDMKFFHALKDAGARIVFASNAFVYENEPDERLTLAYQFRRYFWHGNSSAVTRLERGVGRGRLAVNAGGTAVRGAIRPVDRVVRGKRPQLRFALAKVLEGLGILAGAAGIKVTHK